jgi:hypothetical protein
MKKLKLDDLVVEGFVTVETLDERGTVQAHEPTHTVCPWTCLHTCDGPSGCDPC